MTNLISMDIPGRYPVQYFKGKNYIMVMIDVDSNYISVVPIKSRKPNELIKAFQTYHDKYKMAGLKARILKLNN